MKKKKQIQETCLGIKQPSPANMVLICFQSTGKLFYLKRGWDRVEGGALVSEKERKKINKYFAEGELRGPDANPEQITGKQKHLVGEYHCSKCTASSPVFQHSSSPSFTVSKYLGKEILRMRCTYSRKTRGDPIYFRTQLEEHLGVSMPGLCALEKQTNKQKKNSLLQRIIGGSREGRAAS